MFICERHYKTAILTTDRVGQARGPFGPAPSGPAITAAQASRASKFLAADEASIDSDKFRSTPLWTTSFMKSLERSPEGQRARSRPKARPWQNVVSPFRLCISWFLSSGSQFWICISDWHVSRFKTDECFEARYDEGCKSMQTIAESGKHQHGFGLYHYQCTGQRTKTENTYFACIFIRKVDCERRLPAANNRN